MQLERMTISNFRCFGPDEVSIDFESGITAIVGNNGSGKTALFAALSKLFGTSEPLRAIRKSDFHLAVDDGELASGSELQIDCVFGFPELEDDDADDSAVPEVFTHMSASDADEPLKLRIRLQATWTDDSTPEGAIDSEVRWIAALDNDFEWEECRKVQAVERNFIQLVYVPASRNAFDQVASLLKGRLWRAALWSSDLTTAASEGSQEIQEHFEAEGAAKFIAERLEKRWNEVHQADTDTKPSLRLIENKLADLVRRAEFAFYPDSAGQPRRLEDLSDGQKSLFHIALTAATLEIERDALAVDAADSAFDQTKLRRTYLTLLAIEEPENSLSPFFLSRIIGQARDIGRMDEAQVVISSHSASILSRIEPEEVRYTRLDATTRQSAVKRLTLPADGTDANRYIRLAVKAYPELYFARFVLLGEGESEAIVVPRLAEAMKFPLDRSFVPIVPLGGRFVSHFWRLLNDLDIPHATLLDLDLGRRHGGIGTIKYVLEELAAIGNDLSSNADVLAGNVDLGVIDDIDEKELLDEDQTHPWLKALRREGIFFSSPIDLDFAMLLTFGETYKVAKPGGTGPLTDADAIASKKRSTLKDGGNVDLYDGDYDDDFAWYPYHFLGDSKPEAHIGALSRLEMTELATDAPGELIKLIRYIKNRVLG
ncbi:AAA family ATPase [Citromicrobium bathyomarinum]